MYANPPEAEFLGTLSKFRKKNKISSLLVYILHKTKLVILTLVILTSYSRKNGKEMYKQM